MQTSFCWTASDRLEILIEHLIPASGKLGIQQLRLSSEGLTLVLVSLQTEGQCPVCGQSTRQVHSTYLRTLQDLPWASLRLTLRVQVHRFFCQNRDCTRKIFAERLRDALVTIGWALGGEAGAKHCAAHATPVCASTLLSLLRRQGVAAVPTPRVLGVDDWSFRANQAGTLLVDLEQHRPVDVLLGSDEEVLTQWLLGHAGVEVICRDRGAGYRKAATKSAPRAQQVLDRWHVLKNLGEVIQKTLAQQIDVLRQAGERVKQNTQQTCLAPTGSAQVDGRRRKPPRRKPPAPSPRRAWQMAMHQQVHELAARCENASRDHQPSASASQYGAQVSAHANICGPLLPSVSFSCRALSDLSRRARASRRGHDHHPVARVTRARLHRELQKCVGLRAPLAPSSRDDPRIIFILCGSRDSSECPCHPNAVAGQMAVVASARGSECSGCGLSAGIV